MPIGSASSQRFRDGGDLVDSDTTKKAAPVDTVQLKKNIFKDAQEQKVNADLLNSNIGPQETKYRKDELNKSQDRIYSRLDTLDQARAGKIPVKKP